MVFSTYLYRVIKKINIMSEFLIGDKVSWKVGRVESKGVFLEDDGKKASVVTHFIGGQIANREVEVEIELLNKTSW